MDQAMLQKDNHDLCNLFRVVIGGMLASPAFREQAIACIEPGDIPEQSLSDLFAAIAANDGKRVHAASKAIGATNGKPTCIEGFLAAALERVMWRVCRRTGENLRMVATRGGSATPRDAMVEMERQLGELRKRLENGIA